MTRKLQFSKLKLFFCICSKYSWYSTMFQVMNSNPSINDIPHPWVGWGNSGDLTVPCQKPLSWGVTRC